MRLQATAGAGLKELGEARRLLQNGRYAEAEEAFTGARSAAAKLPGGVKPEDERSIAAKGDWVTETGVGGTILWTINYGWLPGSGTNPLMDAVKESFLE